MLALLINDRSNRNQKVNRMAVTPHCRHMQRVVIKPALAIRSTHIDPEKVRTCTDFLV